MTCIVGIVDPAGKVIIGGDACGTDNWSNATIYKTPKVFKIGDAIVGYSGSYRMGQIIQYQAPHLDKLLCIQDPLRHLVNEWIPKVQELLTQAKQSKLDNSVQISGGCFLLGYMGRLFSVEENFSILESDDNYAAYGSGYLYALGSLHSTIRTKLTPKKRVMFALEAAAHHNGGVAGPFTILEQD